MLILLVKDYSKISNSEISNLENLNFGLNQQYHYKTNTNDAIRSRVLLCSCFCVIALVLGKFEPQSVCGYGCQGVNYSKWELRVASGLR